MPRDLTRWAVAGLLALTAAAPAGGPTVRWDPATRRLLQPGGGYPRLTRVGPGRLLLSFEWGGKSCVRVSTDDGRTFGPVVTVAGRDGATCANPQPIALRTGTTLLFYNVRPRRPNADRQPLTINRATSTDGGRTWTDDPTPLATGGTAFGDGVYEPAAVQLPDGSVDLFFANERPYAGRGFQEITRRRSTDDGKTWGDPRRFSYRTGGRDGMPVPVLLADGRTLAVAIEDNGLTSDHKLKPAILTGPAGGDGNDRSAIDAGTLAAGVYAGAPYLALLPDGRTVASFQSDAGRPGHDRMLVAVGDRQARHFGPATEPFATPADGRGQWNALFVSADGTVTALTTTRLDGKAGVWAVDGRPEPATEFVRRP